MKTKVLFFTAIILTTMFFGSAVNAQDKKGCDGAHKGQSGCLMDDLTEAQKTKVETIKTESDKKMLQYKADLKIKKAELDKLQIAENPSKKDLDAKIDEISVLKANMHKEKVGRDLAIRNELTPEQKTKFDAHRAKCADKNHMHKKDGCAGHTNSDCKGSHGTKHGNAQEKHMGCDKHQMKPSEHKK